MRSFDYAQDDKRGALRMTITQGGGLLPPCVEIGRIKIVGFWRVNALDFSFSGVL